MQENNSLETKNFIPEEQTPPPEQPQRKKLPRVLLLCCCIACFVGVAVWAIVFALSTQKKDDGLIYSYNEANKTAIVTGYEGEDSSVIIPSQIKDYTVIGIDINAFRSGAAISDIFIPETLTAIASGAFSECTKLTSIQVDENNAVYQSIDGNLYSKDASTLIQYALGKNDSTFTLPDSVISVGDRAFYHSEHLESVTLGNATAAIGDSAFYECKHLTSITIPASVKSIGASAFSHCNALDGVYITDLAAWCSISFAETTGIFTTPGAGTSVPSNPLMYAKGLYLVESGEATRITDLVLPPEVTAIGSHAFAGYRYLASVTTGDSVKSIGDSAFHACASLTSVTIGKKVLSIHPSAFVGCQKLVEVINHSMLPITVDSYDYGHIADFAIEVHQGESKLQNENDYLFYSYDGTNYLVGYVGESTDLVLPESYSGENYEIYQYGFNENKSITSLTIPDSVTSIGTYAFAFCENLESVTMGNSVQTLGNSAFSACSSLTSINLPDSVTSIGDNAFSLCTSLTSVTLSGSLTTISEYAFGNCISLTSIAIPDSVIWMAWNAFSECRALKIYCEASSQPETWDPQWNPLNRPVVWGYKEN